jgi:outer membrane protein OmpA-like peptidoglycan-associated protein
MVRTADASAGSTALTRDRRRPAAAVESRLRYPPSDLRGVTPDDAISLQRAAGNAAVGRLLARRPDTPVPADAERDHGAGGAAPVLRDGINVYFRRNSAALREDAEAHGSQLVTSAASAVKAHLGRHPDATVTLSGYASEEGSPSRNQVLSERRAHRVAELLAAAGIPRSRLAPVGRGVSRDQPGLAWNRRVLVEVPNDSSPRESDDDTTPAKPFRSRGFTWKEGGMASRLESLAYVAGKEGPEGKAYAAAVNDFRKELGRRLMAQNEGDPLPPDLAIVMRALMLWSRDSGTQWGEGIWDSRDLTLTAADYATVPASQNKCNAYVAEVLYGAVGTVHRVHQSNEQARRWFPYRAREWSNPSQVIPNYPVVASPQLGDVWALEGHVGVYLGEYAGRTIYISARDDGSGVFALDKVQHAHGIQIKFMKPGGTYRRYTP